MTISIRSISSSCAMTSCAVALSRSCSAWMGRAMASSTIAPMRSRRCFNSSMSLSKWRCMSAEPSRDVIFGHLFFRVHENRIRLRVFDDAAEHEEGGAVADAGGLLHVVGDDDDGVVVFQLVDQLFDLGRGDGIERRGRLVHQHDFG